MDTPLLASHGESDRPSLSSGPCLPEDSSSEFSRLLEQRSNPLQILAQRLDPEHHPTTTTSNSANAPAADSTRNIKNKDPSLVQRGSWVIVAAGTGSVLHLGFVWGSYMSDVWSETFIELATDWKQAYFQSASTTFSLGTANLASLLQDLGTAQPHFPFLSLLLWTASLLLPCLFMVLAPSWVIRDATNAVNLTRRAHCTFSRGRNLLESSMRWALSTFYVALLLSMVVGVLQLHWTSTELSVKTRVLGGLVAYCSGIGAGLWTLVVLRWPQRAKEEQSVVTRTSNHAATTFQQEPLHSNEAVTSPEEEGPAMTVLEDEPPTAATSPPRPSPTRRANNRSGRTQRWCSCCSSSFARLVLVFQLGLLSIVLWTPSLTLPLVKWTYRGVFAHLEDSITTLSFRLILWQLPQILWTQGLAAGTAIWMLVVVMVIFVTTVLIVPLAATILASGAWMFSRPWQEWCRSWLYCLHPAMGSVVFCVALLATLPVLPSWIGVVMLDDSRDFCTKLFLGQDCLSLEADYRPGMWLFLAQSIALESFVVLTLRWNH